MQFLHGMDLHQYHQHTQLKMATETGTFSGLDDLLNKVKLFVTTLSTDAWTVRGDSVVGSGVGRLRNLFFEAPGVGGGKEIFLGFQIARYAWPTNYSSEDVGDVNPPDIVDYLRLQSYSQYSASSGFDNQIGAINPSYTPLVTWEGLDSVSTYWFVADGATLIIYGRIGSMHFGPIYCGFFEPYASDAVYPYPIAVCGTGYGGLNYSRAHIGPHPDHRPFWYPQNTNFSINGASSVQVNTGSWNAMGQRNIWPFGDGDRNKNTWWASTEGTNANDNSIVHTRSVQDIARCVGTISDKPALWPIQLIKTSNGVAVLGSFKKIRAISWGDNASQDDIIRVNGVDNLVMNSTYNSQDRSRLVALELS